MADDHHVMGPDGERRSPDDGRHEQASYRRLSWCAPLSPQENAALDEIELGLADSDPGLFARMSGLDDSPPVAPWARVGGGLAFGVMLFVFVLALPAIVAWALVALVAAVAFLPWLLSVARRPHRR